MKIVVKILSYILMIVLIASLLLAVITNIAQSTFLKEDFILSSLKKNNFYDKVYEQIEKEFSDYEKNLGTISSYVELEKVYSKANVERDVNIVIHNIYTNGKEEINVQEIKTELNNQVDEALGSKKKYLTTSQKNEIESEIDKIANTYKTRVTSLEKISDLSTILTIANNFLTTFRILIYLLPVGIFIIILILNIMNMSSAFRYLGISTVLSGIILLAPKLLSFLSPESFDFASMDSYSNIVKDMVDTVLNNMAISSGILVIVGIVIIIISNIYKARKKEKNIEEEFEI